MAAAAARAVAYGRFGDPAAVLRMESVGLRQSVAGRPAPGSAAEPAELAGTEVHVDMLAAPVNPSDINQVQGLYPIKPAALPAVAGMEGVGRVVAVGPQVTTLRVGDWVAPTAPCLGTWRTSFVGDETLLMPLKRPVSLELAATLTVNPATAYRMLRDFVSLADGEAIIQNAANSGVGRAVIQLARLWKIPTINVIRDRPDVDKLRAELSELGATAVITEQELESAVRRNDVLAALGKPAVRLGLNAVGGRATTTLLKWLTPGATLVTYGGMSRLPVTVPTSQLIFDDVALRGFWMARWYAHHTRAERQAMFDHLVELEQAGHFRPAPVQRFPLDAFAAALGARAAQAGKPLLVMSAD